MAATAQAKSRSNEPNATAGKPVTRLAVREPVRLRERPGLRVPVNDKEAAELIDDLQRRLQLVVEGLPEYGEEFQPRPYREVLWWASRHVYDALSGMSVMAKSFAVFPIDDHGDVDPSEDVRQSLPPIVAEQVIQKAGSLL